MLIKIKAILSKNIYVKLIPIIILVTNSICQSQGQPIQLNWLTPTLGIEASDFLISPSNKIYTVGSDKSVAVEGDIMMMKYDSSGNILWRQRYEGSNMQSDVANGLCLDDSENVYICGRENDNFSTSNSIIIKYDSAGNLKWLANTPNSREAQGIISDGINNIYALELLYDSTISQYKAGLSKYDYSGNLIWFIQDTVNAEIVGYSIKTDRNNNIYIVGYTTELPPYQKSFLSKYDTSGMLIWKKIFNDSIYIFSDTYLISIDDSCNIYISGYTTKAVSATGFDCIAIKYDSTGSQDWFRTWTVSGSNTEGPLAICSRNNRTSITGRLQLNSSSGLSDIFTISYSSTGSLIFSDTLNDPYNNSDYGSDILIDSLNNTIITGTFGNAQSSRNINLIVASYDEFGNRFILDTMQTSRGLLIKEDAFNNLYLCGGFGDTINNFDYGSLLKYKRLINKIDNPNLIVFNEPVLYPNPTNSFLIIDNIVGNYNLTILDMNGSVMGKYFCKGLNREIISLSYLLPGKYIIEMYKHELKYSKCIIKL